MGKNIDRRNFIKKSASLTAVLLFIGLGTPANYGEKENKKKTLRIAE